MNNRTTFIGGYSRKTKQSEESHSKSQSTEAPRVKKIPTKLKLPELPPQNSKFPATNTQRTVSKYSSIIRPIEEKSKDYENAIKDHLGIKNLSRDSSFSSPSPKSKPKPWARAKKVQRSFDASQLASIEHEETRISDAIKSLVKSTKKKTTVVKSKHIEEKDKEIQKVQESLNQINVLLNKILQKSSNKNK